MHAQNAATPGDRGNALGRARGGGLGQAGRAGTVVRWRIRKFRVGLARPLPARGRPDGGGGGGCRLVFHTAGPGMPRRSWFTNWTPRPSSRGAARGWRAARSGGHALAPTHTRARLPPLVVMSNRSPPHSGVETRSVPPSGAKAQVHSSRGPVLRGPAGIGRVSSRKSGCRAEQDVWGRTWTYDDGPQAPWAFRFPPNPPPPFAGASSEHGGWVMPLSAQGFHPARPIKVPGAGEFSPLLGRGAGPCTARGWAGGQW